MRAVTQNRRMAVRAWASVRRCVDALTFGLGSGIAGLAGVALSQIDNVSPEPRAELYHRQLHGGGASAASATSAGHAGGGPVAWHRQQVPRALSPAPCWPRSCILVFIILFIQRRPRGLFALKGRAVE